MLTLALGGHTSVNNLLYERDCLAAALAAEKRRSAEFEQLWRRSEQELLQLRAKNLVRLRERLVRLLHVLDGCLEFRELHCQAREYLADARANRSRHYALTDDFPNPVSSRRYARLRSFAAVFAVCRLARY